MNWVEAAARGGEAVLRVLLADAEASGEPDAGGHPDERVLDAADVRAPREPYLDSGEVVHQDLLEWLLFEGEVDVSPRPGGSRGTSGCCSTATASRCLGTRRRSRGARACTRRWRCWGLNEPAEAGVRREEGTFAATPTIGFSQQ